MDGSGLKKEIGVFGAMSIIGGIVIGSGVFYVGSFVIERAGFSIGIATAAWIFAGCYALMAGLCYAELGAAMPEAGGAYVYLKRTYGPLVAFMMGWTDFWISCSASISALALGFATYLSVFVPLSAMGVKLAAVALIVLLSVVNMLGVKNSGRLQSLLMVMKLVPIFVIIVFGLSHLGGGAANPVTFEAAGDRSFFSTFALAVMAALWAYDGWSSVTLVTEEIKDPEKNLPKAMFLAIGGVTIIYTLFNFVLMKLLPLSEMAADPNPGSSVSVLLFGKVGAAFITVAILISILGATNGSILAFPRETYAMARDKRFFAVFATIHPKFHTPVVAQFAMMIVSIAVIFIGSFEQITVLVVFTQTIFYTMAILALFILRKRCPDMKRPYKVLGYPVLPGLTLLWATWLLVNSLIEDPSGSVMGLIVPVTGIPLYFYFNKKYGDNGAK